MYMLCWWPAATLFAVCFAHCTIVERGHLNHASRLKMYFGNFITSVGGQYITCLPLAWYLITSWHQVMMRMLLFIWERWSNWTMYTIRLTLKVKIQCLLLEMHMAQVVCYWFIAATRRHNDESYNYVMRFSADLAVMLGIRWLFEVCCQHTSECR